MPISESQTRLPNADNLDVLIKAHDLMRAHGIGSPEQPIRYLPPVELPNSNGAMISLRSDSAEGDPTLTLVTFQPMADTYFEQALHTISLTGGDPNVNSRISMILDEIDLRIAGQR